MAESKQELGGRVRRKCKPCYNKDIDCAADIFCSTCNEFQCNECSNAHKYYTYLQHHKILSVNEALSKHITDDAEFVDLSGLGICESHQKPSDFYCNDHMALACFVCAIIYHRTCVLERIDTVECIALQEQLQTRVTTANQVLENMQGTVSRMNSDIQRITERLKEMKITMNETFDRFAENVTKDAQAYKDSITADWGQKQIECDAKLETMKSSLEKMNESTTNGTPLQQFITARRMKKSIKIDMKNMDSLCADLSKLNISCDFDKQLNALRSEIVHEMKPSEFTMKYFVSDRKVLPLIASIDSNQMRNIRSHFCGCDFLPDGRLVVINSGTASCLLYDESLVLKFTYRLPCLYPECVVAVSDEEVAITTGYDHKLIFLHVHKSNEVTLNRTCDVKVPYSSISLKDDENFVVGTWTYSGLLARIVDTSQYSGPLACIVSRFGEETDFDIKLPRYGRYSTYIRGQDKLAVTDGRSNTVYIYDTITGERVEINSELIMEPRGLAVCPRDHVFVACMGTRSVVEITPAGAVLASYPVQMKSPELVAVSKDRRLAVSNYVMGSTELRLYKLP